MNLPVVPLSPGQRLDVNSDDIVDGGIFRTCDLRRSKVTDKLPEYLHDRIGRRLELQFVVQLKGCNLDCPYCYVTREGVWGGEVMFSTQALAYRFANLKVSGYQDARVFHLMGGAPAIYLDAWPELIEQLEIHMGREAWIFHSDLLCTEKIYDGHILAKLVHPKAVFAVNVKGTTEGEHYRNTRRPFPEDLFWDNLIRLEALGLDYYITFTNIPPESIRRFWEKFDFLVEPFIDGEDWRRRKREAFSIDIIPYKAIALNDLTPWGGKQHDTAGSLSIGSHPSRSPETS